MLIKPAQGLVIRNPETKKLLPADGIEVPDNSVLWNKLINQGDVVLAKPVKEAK